VFSPITKDGVISEVRGIIKGRFLILLLLPLYPTCQLQSEVGCFHSQSNISSTQTHLFSKHDLSVDIAISVYNASIAQFILWLWKTIMKLRVPYNINLCGICYGVASLVPLSALEFILLVSDVFKQSLLSNDGKATF
jgi:hypothetical protein